MTENIISGLKGQNITAQGNALGEKSKIFNEHPERAVYNLWLDNIVLPDSQL